MDSRYYEKMLEVMVSLESSYSKPVTIKRQDGSLGMQSDIEAISSPTSPITSSSPLYPHPLYTRSRSLFQSEKSQLDDTHFRTNFFRSNTKDVPQEKESFASRINNFPIYKDDSHIYEKVTISRLISGTELSTCYEENKLKENSEFISFTIIDGDMTHIGDRKDSLEILKRKGSRCIIDAHETDSIQKLQNAPDKIDPASIIIPDDNLLLPIDHENGSETLETKELGSGDLIENDCKDIEIEDIEDDDIDKLVLRTVLPELPERARELSIKSEEEIIKFYLRDGSFSSQVITKFQTAISISNLLKETYKIDRETICQIIEFIKEESLERSLEDHENIIDVYYSWENENVDNQFIFQETTHPYKMFQQPDAFPNDDKLHYEISDTMWIKAVNSKWTRASCFIKDGSIFFTLKRESRKKQQIYTLVNMEKVDFYTCSNIKRIKKDYKCPTSELIVLKSYKLNHRLQDSAYLAASSREQLERWLEAMKVAKFSYNQLKNNFLEYQMCFPTRIRSEISTQISIRELYHTFESCSI